MFTDERWFFFTYSRLFCDSLSFSSTLSTFPFLSRKSFPFCFALWLQHCLCRHRIFDSPGEQTGWISRVGFKVSQVAAQLRGINKTKIVVLLSRPLSNSRQPAEPELLLYDDHVNSFHIHQRSTTNCGPRCDYVPLFTTRNVNTHNKSQHPRRSE